MCRRIRFVTQAERGWHSKPIPHRSAEHLSDLRAMNPYYRIVIMVCRLVAAGFILVTVLNWAAYWIKSRNDHTPLSTGYCVYLSIPLVIGVVLLVKSPALARRAAEYLDD
jgi:hypothetical protein